MEEVQELMDKLYNDIKWFENIQDLKQFFDKEWELCHEGHEEAFPNFLYQVRLLISRKERLHRMRDLKKGIKAFLMANGRYAGSSETAQILREIADEWDD